MLFVFFANSLYIVKFYLMTDKIGTVEEGLVERLAFTA